jgi:hypothetical protein
LICFHNGSSVCSIPCRPLRCVERVCVNVSGYIHVVMTRRKCSINDSIKGEYSFIKSLNDNTECTLWNTRFIIAHGGRSDVVDDVKKFRGFESASELYRSSDRRRSAKLVPTLADRGCHVVSPTSPSDRNFDFLDLEPLLFLPSSSSNCSRG